METAPISFSTVLGTVLRTGALSAVVSPLFFLLPQKKALMAGVGIALGTAVFSSGIRFCTSPKREDSRNTVLAPLLDLMDVSFGLVPFVLQGLIRRDGIRNPMLYLFIPSLLSGVAVFVRGAVLRKSEAENWRHAFITPFLTFFAGVAVMAWLQSVPTILGSRGRGSAFLKTCEEFLGDMRISNGSSIQALDLGCGRGAIEASPVFAFFRRMRVKGSIRYIGVDPKVSLEFHRRIVAGQGKLFPRDSGCNTELIKMEAGKAVAEGCLPQNCDLVLINHPRIIETGAVKEMIGVGLDHLRPGGRMMISIYRHWGVDAAAEWQDLRVLIKDGLGSFPGVPMRIVAARENRHWIEDPIGEAYRYVMVLERTA